MQGLTQPTLLLKPFAESGDKNTIPSTNTDASNPQLADLTNGFPQITSESPDNGGLPPERKDFNGLGYLTTTYDYFYQAGGTFTFSPTISSAIGGYPQGARLWYTDANGVSCILRSTINNNTNNFLNNTSVIGLYGSSKPWVIESFRGIGLNEQYVSNCITEIPQDIKLELNNGTLTLKSGSIITGTNGTQVQTTADRSLTVSSDGQYFVYCTMNGAGIGSYSRVSRTGSGSSLPSDDTNYTYFYNTSDNKIYAWVSNSWVESSISLPLCIFTVSGGAISRIDQIFNGFGYMGTMFYVLPGVKGIAPNGRNIDGTLNGTDISITGLYVNSVSSNGTYAIRLRAGWIGYSEFIYKEDVNYNYNAYVAAGNERVEILAGYITLSGGKITNFSPKTVFHSADYNDVALKNGNNTFSGSATFGNSVEFQVKPITDTLSNDDRYISKWSNYAQGTAPSNNVYGGVDCWDSNGVEIASCYGSVDTSNTSRAALWVKSPVSGSSQTAQILIQCDSSGNFSTYAPTPATGDDSHNIATTQYVQNILKTIYPVGSIYIGTQSTCPLATLISGSTWVKVEGRYLLASGTLNGTSESYSATNTVAAGLPNITGSAGGLDRITAAPPSGCFYNIPDTGDSGYTSSNVVQNIGLDASKSSSIYGQSTTNRPTAYVVNVWRRTA